ncbi:MAG: DUF4286 family protein [Bacteroidota bacterium]
MYIYNVTINIDESIQKEWLKWMREKHIPDMLATGKFIKALMTQVMVNEEMGGFTYSIQYTCDSKEILEKYYIEDANRLRNESQNIFSNKFVAFRTELNIIDEFIKK